MASCSDERRFPTATDPMLVVSKSVHFIVIEVKSGDIDVAGERAANAIEAKVQLIEDQLEKVLQWLRAPSPQNATLKDYVGNDDAVYYEPDAPIVAVRTATDGTTSARLAVVSEGIDEGTNVMSPK